MPVTWLWTGLVRPCSQSDGTYRAVAVRDLTSIGPHSRSALLSCADPMNARLHIVFSETNYSTSISVVAGASRRMKEGLRLSVVYSPSCCLARRARPALAFPR